MDGADVFRESKDALGSRFQICYSASERRLPAVKEQLTAVFQKIPEGYIAFVEELPGANAQGDTLEEARTNLKEAVQLVLEANRTHAKKAVRDKPVIREPLAQICMKRVDLPFLPK